MKRFKHFKIRYCVDEPNFDDTSHIPDYIDWGDTPYGYHDEDLPLDAVKPLQESYTSIIRHRLIGTVRNRQRLKHRPTELNLLHHVHALNR